MKTSAANVNVQNRTLYTADNLFVLRSINDATIDLIYLDPPFNTGRQWADPTKGEIKFEDTWSWSDEHQDLRWELRRFDARIVDLIDALAKINGDPWKAYLTYMGIRLLEMHRILKPTGSIYFHCDSTMSHGVKLIMDAIFGKTNFRNEVVWRKYAGRKNNAKHKLSTQHECLLFYAKTSSARFCPLFIPHSEEQIKKKYDKTDKDGRRYRLTWGRNFQISGTQKRIYLDESPGRAVGNLWTEGGLQLNTSTSERTGYPTQKPLSLLERVIKLSSARGGIVLDPFCGCATACVAAEMLGRQWIGIDISDKAAGILLNRLYKVNPSSKKRQLDYFPLNWVYYNSSDKSLANAVNKSIDDWKQKADGEAKPKEKTLYKEIYARMAGYKDGKGVDRRLPVRTDLPPLRDKRAIRADKYAVRNGQCVICGKAKDVTDMEVDHIVPKTEGGQDIESNFQVICQHCNKIKGSRPMAWAARQIRQKRAQQAEADFNESMDEAE